MPLRLLQQVHSRQPHQRLREGDRGDGRLELLRLRQAHPSEAPRPALGLEELHGELADAENLEKSLIFLQNQNKQLEKIQKINITSEDDLNNLLNEDVSTCCPRRKRKSLVKPAPAPVKRPSMNNGFMSVQPPAKKISLQPSKSIRIPNQVNTYRPQHAVARAAAPGKKNDEIVCTPDIMGLFNDNNDDGGNSSSASSSSLAVPPLVMRNNQRPTRPQAPAPIYVS